MNNNQIAVSVGILVKNTKLGNQYLLVKTKESEEWELPRVAVRKGESSVRAIIRLIGEQAGITAQVLEEAGRHSSVVLVNDKAVPQKQYYYLMKQIYQGGEIIGFKESTWMLFPKMLNSLPLKREKDIFKGSKEILKEWEKKQKLLPKESFQPEV